MIAYAQAHVVAATNFVTKIKDIILYPLISLLLGIAVIYFLWGVFQMVLHAGSGEARTKGRTHMLFGIIGIVVMLSALTIIRIAANTFNVPVPNP